MKQYFFGYVKVDIRSKTFIPFMGSGICLKNTLLRSKGKFISVVGSNQGENAEPNTRRQV